MIKKTPLAKLNQEELKYLMEGKYCILYTRYRGEDIFFLDSRLCRDVASCLIYFKQQFPYCGLWMLVYVSKKNGKSSEAWSQESYAGGNEIKNSRQCNFFFSQRTNINQQ